MSNGIVRTFSFENLVLNGSDPNAQGTNKATAANSDNPAVKKASTTTPTPSSIMKNEGKADGSEATKVGKNDEGISIGSATCAERHINVCSPEEAKSVSINPFMSTEETKSVTMFEPSVLSQLKIPTVDHPPQYLPNRKAYTGSPDFVLNRKSNKLNKFLPKAFTVQMEDDHGRKGIDYDKLQGLKSQKSERTLDLKERQIMLPSKQNTATTQNAQENAQTIVEPDPKNTLFCCRLDSATQKHGCNCIIL